MSLGALTGFAQGLGTGMERKKRAEMQEKSDARRDRYIDALQSMGTRPEPGGMMPDQGMTHFMPGSSVDNSGYGSPAGQSSDGGDNTLSGLLYKHEGAGDASTLFGHSQRPGGKFAGVRVEDMTIDEASQFSDPSGPYGQWVKSKVGRVATPMGYGQIVGTTLRRTAKQMGLPGDTKFDKQTQSKMVNYLARNRLAGAKSQAAKRAAMRAEWEGFKNVSDATLDAAISNFELGGASPARPMGTRPI